MKPGSQSKFTPVKRGRKKGVIPKEALDIIKEKATFDIARIEKIEEEVRHDVIAFLTAVGETVGPESRFIHLGLTSSDVVDTSLSYLLKEAGALLLNGMDGLKEALKKKSA